VTVKLAFWYRRQVIWIVDWSYRVVFIVVLYCTS